MADAGSSAVADEQLLQQQEQPSEQMDLSEDDAFWPKPLIYGGSRKGAKQWQEDSYLNFISSNGKVIVGGVMDGHGGYNGLVASTTARDTLLAYLQRHSNECEQWTEDDWKQLLPRLFREMHEAINRTFLLAGDDKIEEEGGKRYKDDRDIVRMAKGDPVHGGTTCTVVVQLKHADGSSTVITANVGDSTALLIPAHGGKYQWLTVDHGPENPDEWRRVNQDDSHLYDNKLLFVYDKTSVVRKYDCPQVFLPSGRKDMKFVKNPWAHGLHPTNVRYEPAVYAVTPRSVNRDSTCIAMTRALGDFYAHQFGLTFVPDIVVRELPAGQSFTIAAASDGIWDCWKYEEFADYINQSIAKRLLANREQQQQQPVLAKAEDEVGLISQIGELALNESVHRAISNFGAKHYDDAALVCWFVQPATSRPYGAEASPQQEQQQQPPPSAAAEEE